jgi:predicted DNA-binding antitoxin AbrB/MazE fold protein
MVVRGRVENGVVVVDESVNLPEGTEVSVVLPSGGDRSVEKLTDEQRRRLREALQRFEALPDENPGDTFSGADHDRVLYGDG